MEMRDQIDSTRDVAPLSKADDAIVIDSDKMNLEQVLDWTREMLDKWRAA